MHDQTAMNEKEMLDDLLNGNKQLAGLYTTAITESSCQNMRQVLQSNMEQVCCDQYQIFDQMCNKGYYTAKEAPPAEVQQAKQKFSQMQSQLQG